MRTTWGKIKQECIDLGFETTPAYQKNKSIFITSVNRAIMEIATTVKPVVDRYVITQNPLKNLLQNPLYNLDIKLYEGEPLEYKAKNAKAYYFECDGTGIATITNGIQTEVINMSANREFKPYKGFMSGDITITFSGSYAYSIRNVAVYGITTSDKVEDIQPYTQYIKYDVAELTKENGKAVFMDFDYSKPIRQGSFSDGDAYKVVADYHVEQNRYLLLNAFEKGQFEVWYKKYPTLIDDKTPNEQELDIDFSVTPLIPLLASFYIWLDDDDRKATMYFNRYDDMKNQILGRETNNNTITIEAGRW